MIRDDDAVLRQLVGLPFIGSSDLHIGVAVSGGGDSVALLDLIDHFGQSRNVTISAATVNHGLRPEAVQEAATVAAFCAARGIGHATLHWDGAAAPGNLQNAARNARYRLLAGWAQAQGISVVALGHTQDDQAETVLMRIAREAGVDGLSGMPDSFTRHDLRWTRPLLDVSRARLRAYLVRRGIAWVDDPSNIDQGYERARVRRTLAALTPLGIGNETLANVAAQMADTRRALEFFTAQAAVTATATDRGDLLIDVTCLHAQPGDIRRRLLVGAIMWLASATYPPRRDDVGRLLHDLGGDTRQTLGGCLIERRGPTIRLTREARAVEGLSSATDKVWDGRWQLDGPHAPDLTIRALGEAVSDCLEWRASGLPRNSLLASPAIWYGGTLIAAPLAGHNPDWQARIVADYAGSLIAH